MSIATSCSHYCWGPIHIHPQSESLSQDLWMIGQSITGIPGLISEVAASQDAEVQPLTERIVDHIYLGLMGFLALSSAPVWLAGAGIALVGEKALESIDVLHGMAIKVEKFGRSLSEQEKIIEEFGPILDLSDKVADISKKAEQKTAELKKSTEALDELEKNYEPNADLLERTSEMLNRLQTALTERISQANITGLKEKQLTARVTVLKQIEKEEHQMKLLAERINEFIERVGGKAQKLDQLQIEATLSTQVKEEQITGLQRDVQSLQTALIQEKRVTHGYTVQIFA